jgi:hypothetical protein
MTADAPLTDDERAAIDEALADTGCHGFANDHPELYAAVESILENRRLEWEAAHE